MARKQSKTLTEGELRIMKVVWELERASVRAVTDRLVGSGKKAVAYNTVQTMMGILADKGYLAREKEGRAFVYRARVNRAAARAEALQHLVGQFFGGSRRELLHNLLGDEPVDATEIDELRQLLDEASAANAPKKSKES